MKNDVDNLMIEIYESIECSAAETVHSILRDKLPRIKAQWQAEALEETMRWVNSDHPPAAMTNNLRGAIGVRIDELRRQAEEGESHDD